MTSSYPGAIDALTNPASTDTQSAVPHAAQHANANDAIEAIETFVGVAGSTDPASIEKRLIDVTAAAASGLSEAAADIRYAPIAHGVTGGDAHNHDGGDVAQVAYASLSGLPTLGTAAATNSSAYATATQGSDADAHSAASAPHTGHSTPASVTAAIAAQAPAETTTTIGALLNSATSKTAPVDADHMGIMDSAAANIWKKLSWANLKTALSSIFALLAGKAGGQTINGGTAAGEGLILSSTTHATKGAVSISGGSTLTSLTFLTDAGASLGELRISGINNAFGKYAQAAIPGAGGSSNNAFGDSCQRALTTGINNSGLGSSAQRLLVDGNHNCAMGEAAQYFLSSGSANSGVGYAVQRAGTTGSRNSAFGAEAQRYLSDGTTQAAVYSYCTHIGANTKLSAESVTYETVIGAHAIGLGSNTVAIGNDAVTRTGLRGSVEVIAPSSTTAAQSQAGISASWVVSTHATRKARGVLNAWDFTGQREGFRWEADGTQVKTSVNGVAAVARAPALTAEIPGDATRDELRLTELYNACKNFGIIN